MRASDPGGFFLPDLCNVQSVFLLVLVGELLAVVLSISGLGLRHFSWEHFAMVSLFVQWTALLSAAALCQLRPRLSHRPREWAAALSYLVILGVTALVSLAAQALLSGVLSGQQWRLDGWALLDNLLISAVLAGIALRYFYLTQELRQRQRAELEARIQALQSRIRPHFLFNSMNSIASLIGIDPAAAEAAVEDLATLFRATLAQASAEVTMAEELELCRRYLRIEQLRLGDRLRVEWQVEGLPEDVPIPSLTLQPLLENAIYHGIQVLPEGGEVRVSGAWDKGWVRLQVDNPLVENGGAGSGNGQGINGRRRDGNRMALDNIGRRLQALYGDNAGVDTELAGGRFRTHVFYYVEGWNPS